MIGKLADAADILAASVVVLALAAVGAPEIVVFRVTGQLVIAADIEAAPVAALAAVGAPDIVVSHVAIEGLPAAEAANTEAGLGSGDSNIRFADVPVYMYC
jgi:hypothetical protein